MEASRPTSFRTRPESILYAVFALCFAVLGIAGTIESEAGGYLQLGLLRLSVALSVAAFLGLRMARLGVFIEAEGIRVRNPLRTRTVLWRNIRGFTLRRFALGGFGIAELHDGRTIRLWGIQPRSRVTSPRDRRAELAVASLNRELQEARMRGSSRSGRGQHAAQVPHGAPSPERT